MRDTYIFFDVVTILLNEFSPFPLVGKGRNGYNENCDNSLKRVLSISTDNTGKKYAFCRCCDNSLKRVLSISTFQKL